MKAYELINALQELAGGGDFDVSFDFGVGGSLRFVESVDVSGPPAHTCPDCTHTRHGIIIVTLKPSR